MQQRSAQQEAPTDLLMSDWVRGQTVGETQLRKMREESGNSLSVEDCYPPIYFSLCGNSGKPSGVT